MSEMQPHDRDASALSVDAVPGGPPAWVTPQQPAWAAQPIMTDQRQANGAVVVIAWTLTVFSLGYLLPWAIAASRGKSNQASVGLINFFLGWTFLGWVAAMVMACQAHQVVGYGGHTTVILAQQFSGVPQPAAAPGPGWFPAPSGGGQRYWDGTTWTDHWAP